MGWKQHEDEPWQPDNEEERQNLSTNIVRGLVWMESLVANAKDHLTKHGDDCPKVCVGAKAGQVIGGFAEDESIHGRAGMSLLLALAIRTMAEQELEREGARSG